MEFSRQKYWIVSHFLLQRIFPWLMPCLLHCRQILLPLSHWRSPFYGVETGKPKLQGSPAPQPPGILELNHGVELSRKLNVVLPGREVSEQILTELSTPFSKTCKIFPNSFWRLRFQPGPCCKRCVLPSPVPGSTGRWHPALYTV